VSSALLKILVDNTSAYVVTVARSIEEGIKMAKLTSLDQCADRIEAACLVLQPTAFMAIADRLRRNEIDLHALSHMRREADRLIEGLNAVERILAEYQGRTG
jgi:hypothetical protein